MVSILFVGCLSFICAVMLILGCKYLPQERWQVLATLPVKNNGSGEWQGVNLTFYGLLTANAYMMALLILVVLLRALDVSLIALMTMAIGLLFICVPASRIVAGIVEGKAYTFTVGGAVFIGTLVSPWLILTINSVGGKYLTAPDQQALLPLLPTLAAVAIAYALGEGLGRLACISFGCCYGKPLSQCGPFGQRLFSHFNFVFFGATKKICYASGLVGQPVVPIQAITAILYVVTALIGTGLFVSAHYQGAFLLCALTTQGWRVYSEFLRADYRGDCAISAYQWMGVIGMVYVIVVALLSSPSQLAHVDIGLGLRSLWSPTVLIVFQGVWLSLFWYTGKSSVTGSRLSFFVYPERI